MEASSCNEMGFPSVLFNNTHNSTFVKKEKTAKNPKNLQKSPKKPRENPPKKLRKPEQTPQKNPQKPLTFNL